MRGILGKLGIIPLPQQEDRIVSKGTWGSAHQMLFEIMLGTLARDHLEVLVEASEIVESALEA